ncbi:uncharacterized protein LOC128301993 [Anopheles moucheti]|uniref:uncharacterized protein LOC128301993 n=1 Tax=Anopheles moucheti TaxID=186751 RepID=UPI0022F0FB67|nr:uncharacterized protein LOC128301993 [Anopheles moucheti]
MVIKVYISGMSGNKEVKKRQQRVTMIMESKHIEYTVIDITEPGQEAEKDFMQTNAQHKGCTISDPNPRHALPPQLFNDTEYCGDYDDFDMANEVDNLEVFLKLAAPAPEPEHKNGDVSAPATDAAAEDEDENKENKTEDNGAAGDGAEATEDVNEATKVPPEEAGAELQSDKEIPDEEAHATVDEKSDSLKEENETEELEEKSLKEEKTLTEDTEVEEPEVKIEKVERTEAGTMEHSSEESNSEDVDNASNPQKDTQQEGVIEFSEELERPRTVEDNTTEQLVVQNDNDLEALEDTTEEQVTTMEHESDNEESSDDSVPEDPEGETVEETNVDVERKEECEIDKDDGEMPAEEEIVNEAVQEEPVSGTGHSEVDQPSPNNKKEDHVEEMEVEQEILTDEDEASESVDDSEGDSQIENPPKTRTSPEEDVAESSETQITDESRSIGEAEEPAEMEADGDDDAEEQELRRASAALAGKSEDAVEQIGMDEAEEEEEEDEADNALVEAVKEDEISSKLVDTDDPMMAEQEQEE